jgi:hypothetical protein
LATFDCSKCDKGLQSLRGCYGNARAPYWQGTEHETDTCPRRHALSHPLVPLAHRLYNHTDGKLGVDVFERPAWIAEAFAVIDDAIAHHRKEHADAD